MSPLDEEPGPATGGRPVTAGSCTGLVCWPYALPSPSCPDWLAPQHQTELSAWMPQVCAVPPRTARQVMAEPTFAGDMVSVTVPSPRRPLPLLPQHHRVP